MAQHDYVIANAAAATVRADINAAFDAVATLNSGATAPADLFANMWWFDTATGLLKKRNAANTAWEVHDPATLVGASLSDLVTDLSPGTAKARIVLPYPIEILTSPLPYIWVNTAPTGSAITVDMNVSGSTILSTKLTIDPNELDSSTAATPAVLSSTSVSAFAPITFDIDAVGSTIPGKGLAAAFLYKRTG